MADEKGAITAAQQNQQPDLAAQLAEFKTLLGGLATQVKELAGNQKVLADTLTADKEAAKSAAAAAKTGDEAKPLTLDDVKRLLGEQQQTQAAQAARAAYQAEKLKDLPAIYRDRLGTDQAKFATDEQAIREQYKADFKAAGGQGQTVDGGQGTAGAATAAAAAVDLSKLSGQQLIEQGLKASKPVGAAAAATLAAQQQQQQQQQAK